MYYFYSLSDHRNHHVLLMKDVSRPPDAVLCECSMLAARKPKRLPKKVHDAERRSRSFGQFLETIVRKVFDNQRKAKEGTQSWNESADLNATPVSSLTRDLKKLDLNSPHAAATVRSLFNDSSEEPYTNHVNKLCLEDSFSGTSDSSNSLDNSKVGRGLNASKSFRLLDESLTAEPEKEYDGFIPRSQKPRTIINYPKFHFPQGKPVSQYENDAALKRVCEVFRSLPNQTCSADQMGEVCEAAGIPLFWKKPLFQALVRKENRQATLMDFTAFWRAMTGVAHDEAARFVYTLTAGTGSHLTRSHFVPLVMDVIHSHPGLEFYRSSVEFHDKFCDVVISRIFWNVHRPWAHSLTAQDIRKSDLLEKIRDLQTDEDINKNFRYFSYEHFYVIYCNFWELDTNHDMLINRSDLERHGKYAIPRVIVDRIFSGAIRPASKIKKLPDYIDISEYTYFLLADEDKNHPMSIEYWFRIIDLDGDGLISFYDMEYFHNFVIDALSQEGIETLKFEDVVCHLIDAVNPKNKNSFKLADLKGNKMAPKFFNSLVNWRKFYHQETNEVSEARVEDESGRELTDWDRYCVEEYEALMDTTNDEDGVENFEVHLEDDDEMPTTSYTDLL
ncbi:unnamed protein product [Auanema sp. JU1783]|nr:unnamed protein product [Auanema sp. JU1783]